MDYTKLLVLDTETTGLNDAWNDEAIELAIVDWEGNTLFNQRFKPEAKIHPKAQEVHGIAAEDLADCPIWADAEDEIKAMLADRPLVIFNADFDLNIMLTSALSRRTLANGSFEDMTNWVTALRFHSYCAMYWAADVFGATNSYGTISLANAVKEAGIKWQGNPHSAEGDALTTLALVKEMLRRGSEFPETMEHDIEENRKRLLGE